MIYGQMLIMHLTAVSETCQHCGTLFYARSDSELVKFKSVVDGMMPPLVNT